jgi:uncharacterized phiE125 gp8 family phage protein
VTVFVQPPFWSTRHYSRTPPHAVSVVVTPPAREPLTLEQGKLVAGQDWAANDPRELLMKGWIAAARAKVELDTGLALLTQTRDIYYDRMPGDVFTLPAQSMPLQSVTSIKSVDTAGVTNTLATDQYLVDLTSGRVGLSDSGSWPTDLRSFQPIVIRIVAGYASVALIPALLLHAVGLLVAHFATFGRDLVSLESLEDVPYGYQDAIAGYQTVTLP